jgi:hypothetical protein
VIACAMSWTGFCSFLVAAVDTFLGKNGSEKWLRMNSRPL